MTQGSGGLLSEEKPVRRESPALLTYKPNCRQSLERLLTTSGPRSGGSRCAVGGAEGPHLRAQPRLALERRGSRPPTSIYTALFWSRALIGQPR